jgi:DUF4097 and DUF4098 domain-containing protein YvlB
MHALFLTLLALFGGVQAQQHLSFTTPGTAHVRVESTNGSIAVTTGGSSIQVTVIKKAQTQSALASLSVSSKHDGNSVSLVALYPQNCSNCGGEISFELTVPAGTVLDLETTNGSIKADGIGADAKLETTNGSVNATYASASGVRSIVLRSTNGSLNLALPTGARLGQVKMDTSVGRISSDWPLTIDRSNFVGAGVDQQLSSGGINVNLNTTNGSINLQKA